MAKKTSPEQHDQIFWKDEPDAQVFSQSSQKLINSILGFFGTLLLLLFLCFGVTVFYHFSPILAWFWLVNLFIMVGLNIYLSKRRKSAIREIARIQQHAIEHTGASLIGSAVHVAGHPLLEREQNVVLALIPPDLAVYQYESTQPLFLIPMQDIISIQTVVYDDERIPHVDVVDSTAQAIQLVLKFGDQQVTCLFRRMKKVRPIDWYHILTKEKQNDAAVRI